MSEYNRFTTAKGNLLLNIAPPSNEYNQTTNYQSLTHYASIPNQNYNLNSTIGAKPHQIDQVKLKSSNGGNGYISEPKVLRESRQNKTNSGRYFSDGRQNREEGVIDQNVEIKQGANATKCCFPGFWLLILVLAVVAATLFIIFLKKGIFEHSVDKNTNQSVNKDKGNLSELQLNSNETYTLSPETEPQQIEPIPTRPNESLSENGGSETSFQFPLEKNEISPVEEKETGANEVKNISVAETEYETSYMIPKVLNRRHFLRRNVMH